MFSPTNQIVSPDDEEDQPEDCDYSLSKRSAIKQVDEATFLSYYNHRFEQTNDSRVQSLFVQNEKWSDDFVCSGAVSSAAPVKFRLMKEGFDLKAKKRKAEVVEAHGGGGGGRVVQSTGRKDRHSKVRTARGPRDRRVRLSPRTAIQFYDVQDRLGYDRPSKAIDWLIKEAKTAIDALNENPNGAEDHGGFLISECGMIEKHESHVNDENPVSGFSFCVDGAVPSSSTGFQALLDQDFNASRNGSEASGDFILCQNYQQGFSALTETNWDMARLQKMLTWNCGNENSGNARGGGGGGGECGGGAEYSSVNLPAQPISGQSHMFSQREPLQSSYINYSPINTDFPGFNFCNELSNITASSTLKPEEKDKKLVFNRPSSTAPFLHYED